MLAEGSDTTSCAKTLPKRERFSIKIAHNLGVRYRYAESRGEGSCPVTSDEITARWRAHSPPALLTRLERATVETDMQRVAALISEIRTHDAALADALSALANDFEYDKILQAIHHPIP
jgi:uncharacterized membrane-anchored protein